MAPPTRSPSTTEPNGQAELFASAPDWVAPETNEGRFWRFHVQHPEVYRQLVTMCRSAKARGRDRLGIAQLFEVLRWNSMLGAAPGDAEEFKLNNSYRAFYARLIMEQEPDLVGIFETRRQQSAGGN